MEIVAMMPFLIPIVAILAGTYAKVAKMKAEAAKDLSRATGHLEDALADARSDRERLRRRLETLEAIVTSEGFDLEREARRAGLVDVTGRIHAGLLDMEPPEAQPLSDRQRARS